MAQNQGKQEKEKEKRSSIWAMVIYPESMPKNWLTILEDTHTPIWISPLHNLDKDESNNGQMKKEHYHVIVKYESLKSLAQVEEITKKLNAPKPIRIDNFKGYLRYLTHMDNPNKAQYNANDIKMLNGATYDITCELTKAQKYQGLKEMAQYISDYNVCEYIDFFLMCANENEIWYQILCDCGSIVVSNLITSQRNKNRYKPYDEE